MRTAFWIRLHLLIWTALVLALGYSFGRYLFLVEEVSAPAPIKMLFRDVHRRVPIVHVKEINDGSIVGVIGTGARLVIGDEVVIPGLDRSFVIPADPFLMNIIDIPIPRDALFVASKKGKKYYKVESSAGKRLSPKNRLYFRTGAEAEAMGYTR